MRALFQFLLCLFYVNAEIRKIFVIWRHGDRAPESLPYPKDPYDESFWPRGWDQLTNEGIRQTFELGKWLRRRYVLGENPLLSRHFDRKQVFFRTSYADRAIESAQAVAAGLFPAEEHSIWHNESHVGWQPIPIFSATRGKIDPLLRPSGVDCTVAKEIISESERIIEKQVKEEYGELFSMLSNWTGMHVNFKNVKKLYGIHMEMLHSLSPPQWIHEIWNDTKVIDHIRELKRITRLAKFNSREKSKLKVERKTTACKATIDFESNVPHLVKIGSVAGVLLNDWAQHLERKDSLKALLYSSHDGTLNSLMYTLGIENNLLVPYAAALILEIHFDGNEEHIQIIYKNETNRAYQLSIPGCTPICSVETFSQEVSQYRITDASTLLKKIQKKDNLYLSIDAYHGCITHKTSVHFNPGSVSERRKTCVRFIQHIRKCSVGVAVLRYLFRRKTLRRSYNKDTLTDYDSTFGSKFLQSKKPEETDEMIISFMEETMIKPTEIYIRTQEATEKHRKLIEIGLRYEAKIRMYTGSPLTTSVFQLIIENYFNGGPYSPFFMEWGTWYEGDKKWNLQEIFNQYNIQRTELAPYHEDSLCKCYVLVYFQRKEGSPVLRFKYSTCKNRDRGEECNHFFTVEIELISEGQ